LKSIRPLDWASLAIISVVVGAWLMIALSPDSKPVQADQVGCYRGAREFADVELHITSDGLMKFTNGSVAVQVYSDKMGYSFYPKTRVVLSETKHQLLTDDGYPDLYRFAGYGGFYIPTDENNLVLFSKCKLPKL
jgi:hypothetical protein